MKSTKIFTLLLPLALLTGVLGGCKEDGAAPANPTTNPPTTDPEPLPNTPFTTIPNELVGTWFAAHNAEPLTTNWEKGTFQGEQGYREFRTMVFTKDGKNAQEYTSQVYINGDETKQYLSKVTGTLEYKTTPASLIFHAQAGTVRVFSNKYSGYKESPIIRKDIDAYISVLYGPQATTFPTATNFLDAQRADGTNHFSVRYQKVSGTDAPPTNPDGLYTSPPATGPYVKVGSLYYPTVVIGTQEWMSVNYAGDGGIKVNTKPHYGTFLKFADLNTIPVPAGWRIPTKDDYVKLLASQGLVMSSWESTDGSDLESKRRLGKLMATTGWLKQDGYATNSSGFTAVPANMQAVNGTPNGEGANCLLWTAERNAEDNPVAFKIIQLPSDSFAAFGPYPVGYNPAHLPVRLVRDK
ncbi:FISUMP domain-containing protein [Hymenobacter cellulosivorans]|uniref:Fibrobacter succinogenes major paralogous domain-containing protein n=1 Tax=Hymenobacter cellulosivorans TaxID=2932249 RepID=A0ABY4F7F3_9BACT|nr:FISUMP domain-containing protein [Hymenobacter cellulosivorans]UOQ52032.1 hypothetical protein MUN80_19990 [Hymenobacter cellulosivorans]